MFIDGNMKRYKAHRLVAFMFLDKPDNYQELVINHKDGNKLNNHYSNLEYCTYNYNNYHARLNCLNNVSESNSRRWDNKTFRSKTSLKFSQVQLNGGYTKGKKNGRFRYEILSKDGKEYTRQELAEYIGRSQSNTDSIIRRAAHGEEIEILTKNNIYIKDTKSKVNRLSKATDNEKTVA